MKPGDRAAAAARFRARLDQLPAPTETHVQRIANLFAAIRLRITRDHARNLPPASEPDPPLSQPDHDGSNVSGSSHVSGVTGR